MGEGKTEPRFGTVNFERRKHPRFSMNLPVEYWPTGTPKSHPGHTGDVSQGGLLLYLPTEISAGQDLRVRLFIDSGLDFMSIEALVRVVWKDLSLGHDEDYRTGVRFVEISAQDHSNLKNFLNTLIEMKSQPRLPAHAGVLSSGVSTGRENVPTAPPESKDPQ